MPVQFTATPSPLIWRLRSIIIHTQGFSSRGRSVDATVMRDDGNAHYNTGDLHATELSDGRFILTPGDYPVLPAPAAGGRLRLNDDVEAVVLDAIRDGVHPEVALAAQGMPVSWMDWVVGGQQAAEAVERGEPITTADLTRLQFYLNVQRAQASAEQHAVQVWKGAFPTDWRAAQVFLERRFPERWRQQSDTKLLGSDEHPIKVLVGIALEEV